MEFMDVLGTFAWLTLTLFVAGGETNVCETRAEATSRTSGIERRTFIIHLAREVEDESCERGGQNLPIL